MPNARTEIACRSLLSLVSALAIALLMPRAATGQPAPFNAFLLPELSEIEAGEIATVTFEIDSTGVQFNAYEITIRFDPGVIRFLDVEEGPLATSACPSNFFTSSEAESTVTISHVILCAGVSLEGPGVLSILSFEGLANGESPLEHLTDPDRTFGDAGRRVNPNHPTFPRQVFLHDAAIQVGASAGLEYAPPRHGTTLEPAVPNPFNPSTEIRFTLAKAGRARLTVFDPRGRVTWDREWSHLAAGPHRVAWHASDSGERRLPSGVYLIQLAAPDRTLRSTAALIR
jgi:hypothetical protein